MVFKTVIDCTNDVNIRHFLQSEKLADIRIRPVFVDDVRYLDKYVAETDPVAIILSTNILSVTEMLGLISGQFKQCRYILCVGRIRSRKDRQNLKILQDEYNCSIIENVVTDLVLFNHIVDCILESSGQESSGFATDVRGMEEERNRAVSENVCRPSDAKDAPDVLSEEDDVLFE